MKFYRSWKNTLSKKWNTTGSPLVTNCAQWLCLFVSLTELMNPHRVCKLPERRNKSGCDR